MCCSIAEFEEKRKRKGGEREEEMMVPKMYKVRRNISMTVQFVITLHSF